MRSKIVKKSCPFCNSSHIHKRGVQSGVQMYKCLSCEKWYSTTTGTPLWDIKKKEKWQNYITCMQKGMSLKKISKQLGISIQTSFDWRHKLLNALSEQSSEILNLNHGHHKPDLMEMTEGAAQNSEAPGENNLKRKKNIHQQTNLNSKIKLPTKKG